MKIANKIFEIRRYNAYLTSEQMQSTHLFKQGSYDKNHFIEDGILNMERVLECFVTHFNDIFGTQPDFLKEEKGREQFLFCLRPIILH